MSESYFLKPKDVMTLYGVSYRTACNYLRVARQRLGKRQPRKNHKEEADPVTLGEFKQAMNITQ